MKILVTSLEAALSAVPRGLRIIFHLLRFLYLLFLQLEGETLLIREVAKDRTITSLRRAARGSRAWTFFFPGRHEFVVSFTFAASRLARYSRASSFDDNDDERAQGGFFVPVDGHE